MSFNKDELISMFGDDQEIFFEIFGDFCNTVDEMLLEVKNSIVDKNSSNLQISAHTLKGVLATFCALKSKDRAFELECLGKNQSFERAQECYSELEAETKILIGELQGFDFKNAA